MIEIKIIVDGQEYEFVPKAPAVEVTPAVGVTETTPEPTVDAPVETSPAA